MLSGSYGEFFFYKGVVEGPRLAFRTVRLVWERLPA